MKRDLKRPDSCGAQVLNRIWAMLLLFSICMVLMALLQGCGKKSPPFLPEKKLAARIDGLTATQINGKIRLEGTLKDSDGGPAIAGCTVYRAWYPEDQPPCEGCPIKMMALTEAVETTVSGNRFICQIPVDQKTGIWFIELRLTDSRGAAGPPSERIKVKIGGW